MSEPVYAHVCIDCIPVLIMIVLFYLVVQTIRSYLRPNCEVAGHKRMKSSPYIPLNATTYDEIEVTNLGSRQAAICLKGHTGLYYQPGMDKETAVTIGQAPQEEEEQEEESSFFSRLSKDLVKGQVKKKSDVASSLTKMFPGLATEFSGESSLEESMKTTAFVKECGKTLRFDQGDTVTIRLDPIKVLRVFVCGSWSCP
ncbi:uncharacterized protein LOC118477480 [Aplysia californica]|uniref:Uncharacterized protein LOC118477480 n=1 Tax=Aplysia californica TaxID=6500 RepID=A0ABM1VR73_APLCA|nr:uncharacterized protein LOC118477480 [Aplysia californica]